MQLMADLGHELIAPDEGGCAEVADPHASALYRAKDAGAAAAIAQLFARDTVLLRRAAIVAAAHVRTYAAHTAELMACYQQLIATGRRLAA